MHKYIVHWMVAILTEQGGTKLVHYGLTHDISLSVATIFCDEKLDLKGPITLKSGSQGEIDQRVGGD
jgi:hypothetical protein